ncbi:hypothetical protein HU200_048168 [Digitaria exilis]|uniref:Cytochrome P450 n=1 Tax=Digitaria exilis TaxID=1010633 RepID=A0A835AT00_9POAL|nr:hypothetical protein HU200_048168 [Digitaria exilis]
MDKAYHVAILTFAFLFVLRYLVPRVGAGGKGWNGKHGKQAAPRLPPSPPSVPFLGHLHLVKTRFHASLARLAARHGPVFSLRLGYSRLAVVVSSPEAAKECFTENDVALANRPLAVASYGPYWRNVRRVLAVHLLSSLHVDRTLSPVVSGEVRAMARRMNRAAMAAADGGGAARVQMKRRLFELSLSVLMETIARTKTSRTEANADSDMSPEAHEFKQIIDDLKAQAEMDAAVGTSRLVTPDDLPRLGYLQSIVNETLRLYPAAPLLLPHESVTDCKVAGYDVPRGTMLLVNVYAIHRDPDEFRPERFEDGKAEVRLLMPFGMGRRRCPGETLALRTIGLVLATLIQCFDWDRVDGAEVDMAEGGGLTIPRIVPLEAICRPRAAMHGVLQVL